MKYGEITMEQVKDLLKEIIPELDFSKLTNIKFTGDATFFQFENDLFVQIRRSGTDAKMRGYSGGPNEQECRLYLDKLLRYEGRRTGLYKKIIPLKYQESIYSITQKLYREYLNE